MQATTNFASGRISAYSGWWLITAILFGSGIAAYAQGAVPWFLARFDGPLSITVSALISGFIAYVWFFRAFRLATELRNNAESLRMFLGVVSPHVPPTERLDAVLKTFGIHSWGKRKSRVGRALTMLRESVITSVACGGKPQAKDEIIEEHEGTLAAFFERIAVARSLLVSLALVGTIYGLVYAFTSSTQTSFTPEESKAFALIMYHGLGVSYISGALGWSGAIAIILFEILAKAEADWQCDRFRFTMKAIVTPVVDTKRFIVEVKKILGLQS